MSDSITDRVTEILADAERGSDELGALEDGDDLRAELEDSGLEETAEEAGELIAEEDAEELLAALGLDELEDGTEPDSLPEAIALGSEEQVGDLQVLVKLAKIGEADEGELAGEVGELREVLDRRDGSSEGGRDTTESGEDEREEEEDEDSLAESAADAVRDAVGEEDGDEEGNGILEEELESAMRSKLEGFGEELNEARARLDSLRGQEEDEVDGEDEEEDAAREEDDEVLGSDSRPRSRGTMHSTMAPPPSRRADMGRSTRHSTMPDR